jgi:hypothetical protein
MALLKHEVTDLLIQLLTAKALTKVVQNENALK